MSADASHKQNDDPSLVEVSYLRRIIEVPFARALSVLCLACSTTCLVFLQKLEAENGCLRFLLSKCTCQKSMGERLLLTSSTKNDSIFPQTRTTDLLDVDKATARSINTRFVALKVMYFGKRFHGFASDARVEPTVESELFKALKKTKLLTNDKKEARYSRCGRTDKGVSAVGQVVALSLRSKFRTESERMALGDIHLEEYIGKEIDYPKVINRALPDDIRVLGWCPVPPDFNARFSCLFREYKYFFWGEDLDLKAMENAGQKFIGEHDFRNFCKMDAENVHNYKRQVTSFSVSCCGSRIDDGYQLCVVAIKGSAFLWHQVRSMVSVLFMIGQGLESPNIICTLLDVDKTDRKPQYSMSPALPLVLHTCEFEDLSFFCSSDVQRSLKSHLRNQYLGYHLKAQVFKEGLISLPHDGTPTRKLTHIPLLSRPTEPSYMERRAQKNKSQITT